MLVLHLVGLCLLLSLSGGGDRGSGMPDCGKNRDSFAYQQGGPFVTGNRTPHKTRQQVNAQIREFLWTHWIKRTRARMVKVSETKEGESATAKYYVEPDINDVWHVCVVVERALINRKNPFERIWRRDSYRASRIDRVEVRDTGLSPYEIIPETDNRPPSRYRIVLRDAADYVLDKL